MSEPTADCGATFEHAWHLYETPRGKVKACDGDTNKRTEETTR